MSVDRINKSDIKEKSKKIIQPNKQGNIYIGKYDKEDYLSGYLPEKISGSVIFGVYIPKFNKKLKEVGGNYVCSDCNLTSLEGAPEKVGGHFDCGDNKLTSLKGGPKEVGGDYMCWNNELTSLEGAPEKIGSGVLWCKHNPNLSSEKIIEYSKTHPDIIIKTDKVHYKNGEKGVWLTKI